MEDSPSSNNVTVEKELEDGTLVPDTPPSSSGTKNDNDTTTLRNRKHEEKKDDIESRPPSTIQSTKKNKKKNSSRRESKVTTGAAATHHHHPKRPPFNWRRFFKWMACFLFLIGCALGGAYYHFFGRPKPELYDLQDYMSSSQCDPVTGSNFTTGFSYGRRYDMAKLDRSMMHYLSENPKVNGISAINFGKPLCYFAARIDDEIVRFFNLKIIEITKERIQVPETSLFCKDKTFHRYRYPEIRVEYTSDTGLVKYGYYKRPHSYYIQQLLDIQNGNELCTKN